MPSTPALTEAELTLRSKARDVFRALDDVGPEVAARRGSRPLSPALWKTLAELDFFANLVPAELGGTAAGLRSSVVILEELAAGGVVGVLPAFAAIGGWSIAHFGQPEIRQQVLPHFLVGEASIAIAATEELAGFNLFAIQTAARKDGADYIVRGEKVYISGADVADYLLLIARTLSLEECLQRGLPKTAGLSVFLLPADADGIELDVMPTRGEGQTNQFHVRLREVHVAESHRLGEEHRGMEVLFPSFNAERILITAMAVGMSEHCLEVACRRAMERKVFGDRSIAEYQAVQHPLAEVRIRQEAVRLMTYQAAAAWDEGSDPAAVARLANFAKYLGSELALKAVDGALEAMGGRGFNEEHGIIQLWEFARLLKLSPISNALILNDVAERFLGLPRSY